MGTPEVSLASGVLSLPFSAFLSLERESSCRGGYDILVESNGQARTFEETYSTI